MTAEADYREALDALLEALSRVDVSGDVGNVEGYDEAVIFAGEVLRGETSTSAERRKEPSS